MTTPATNNIGKAIVILQHTADGENLSREQLQLVERAANNQLREQDQSPFQELYQNVIHGTFRKPWLAEVEHVTADHQGYVYWKNIRVEHFTFSIMDEQAVREAAHHVAEVCQHLETLGIPVTGNTYMNNWLRQMDASFPQEIREFLAHLHALYEHPDGRVAAVVASCREGWPKEARFLEIHNGRVQLRTLPLSTGNVEYHALTDAGYQLAQCGQAPHCGPTAAPIKGVLQWMANHKIDQATARKALDLYHANLKTL